MRNDAMDAWFARVNGQPIWQRELDNGMQGFALEFFRKTLERLSAEELQEVRTLAEEKVLARELIFQAALAAGIVAPESAVREETARLMQNFPDADAFYGTLAKAGIEPATYHRMVRQDLTVNMMTERELQSLPEPTAEEIAAAYLEHPERMQRAARVRACHLLLRCTPENRAEVAERLEELRCRAGSEDFAALAREYSQCPSAQRGGDLGYFKPGTMVKPFEEAAFQQPVGEVGEIVETPFGLHLIKVLAREESAPRSLEEATEDIRTLLREQASARHLANWVATLREAARIEYPT